MVPLKTLHIGRTENGGGGMPPAAHARLVGLENRKKKRGQTFSNALVCKRVSLTAFLLCVMCDVRATLAIIPSGESEANRRRNKSGDYEVSPQASAVMIGARII